MNLINAQQLKAITNLVESISQFKFIIKDCYAMIYIASNHDKIIKTKIIKNIDTKRYLAIFNLLIFDDHLTNLIFFGSLYDCPK